MDALHTQPSSSGGAAFGRLEEHAGCIDLDSPSSPRGDGDGASSEMSSINGQESPPHKRAKLAQQQKKRQGGSCQTAPAISFLDRAVLFENKVNKAAERLIASPIQAESSTSSEAAPATVKSGVPRRSDLST